MKTIDEALAAILDGDRAARGRAARRWPTPPGAWRPRTRPRPSTCRRSTAPRWTATPCAPPTPRPAWRCGSRAAWPPARWPSAELAPGTADGDLHRRGAAARRRRDPAVRARGRSATARSTPERAIEPGRHVRFRGEDVRAGDVLARAGERLTLPRLSALASAGVGRGRRAPPAAAAPARHRARELLPLGAPPEPGRIHESNGLMVTPARPPRRRRRGRGQGVVPDDRAATLEAVERGLAADVLVVSGGVSVGPHDHVKPAFEACGVEEVLLARADQARQAAVVRAPRRHAGVRAARATRCRASSASACSSSRRCGACRASATPARGSSAGGWPGPPRPPTAARRSSPSRDRAGRRRRARGHADRAPGLAHDGRARRERRVRGRAARRSGDCEAGDAGGPAAARLTWRRSSTPGRVRAATRRCCGCRARGGR